MGSSTIQEDARDHSATDISSEVGVAATTVRNRIERLEDRGISGGYATEVHCEEAGYRLAISTTCFAPVPDRTKLAEQAPGATASSPGSW